MKFLNYILINKEARLFDTMEFLLKTFIAVLLGYVLGMKIPFLSRDMISLLFGMMLTIEPVNMTGIKSGLKQVEATIIGAIITGMILALFGYNPWSAALAVTATLYVSLVIDWRSFSVVAVFTSIYMTQYVQLDALGHPSEIETFKLRMAALLTGVAIAFLVNFVFSLLGYKHMLEKRVYHLLDSLSLKMEAIISMIEHQQHEKASEIMTDFIDLLNNTQWIVTTINDFKSDPIVKRSAKNRSRLDKISMMADLIREMNHLSYDMCYCITKGDSFAQADGFATSYRGTITSMSSLKAKLNAIIHNQPIATVKSLKSNALDPTLRQLDDNIAVLDDLLSSY